MQEGIGKSAGEWHFTLVRGKISVSTNDLSPKEATAMSRDIKHIGMDAHKEAIVIAVLNGSGYSAVVGSITDRIREIRLAGKPPCWACLRTASSSGATYMQ